jgi:hypothetical protein
MAYKNMTNWSSILAGILGGLPARERGTADGFWCQLNTAMELSLLNQNIESPALCALSGFITKAVKAAKHRGIILCCEVSLTISVL